MIHMSDGPNVHMWLLTNVHLVSVPPAGQCSQDTDIVGRGHSLMQLI